MSITVPLEGFGSGGNPLNFKVVGGTGKPGNPKENTIWINTNTEITSWIFSIAQPAGEEGMVWVVAGQGSAVNFNVLKKNCVTVYPMYAMQYINGSWTEKDTEIYQDGMWGVLASDMTLYEAGNEHTDVTGGWSRTYTGGNITMNFSKSSSYMTLSTSWSLNYSSYGACGTAKKVNVSTFKKLNILYDFSASSSTYENAGAAYQKLTLGLSTANNSVNAASVSATKGTSKTATIDISALKGEFYVVALAQIYGLDGSYNAKIRKVWLSQ